jgi:hypothetical protein
MIAIVGRLWRGDMPLADAFWNWAVLGGLAVNLTTSAAFYALIVADQVVPALVVGYGLSLPYNLVVTVGVWRAAGRHPGSRTWAEAARIVTLSGMIVLSLT